jgi:predicted acyl esterase
MSISKARTSASLQCQCCAALSLSVLTIFAEATPTAAAELEPSSMQKVQISEDGRRFMLVPSGQRFTPWGFNYLGEFGKLVEDTWREDWDRIERDFREMRRLGGNVVRLHLQFGTYMKGPNEFDQAQLDRLRRLLDVGQANGLYLDITGLSCYRLQDIPAWYDALGESERWDVQARWWQAIAKTCAGHPAVFCYDLMNEPIIGGPAKEGEPRWVGGELAGFYFVQRISEAAAGRTSSEIAEAWAKKLTSAIRKQDPKTLITVGVIPWAQIWPNAKPVFYSPEAAKHFDFVSIHSYPDKDKVDQALAALAVYDIGKPLVVEETFPMTCTLDEMNRFVDGGKDRVDGWISHYFGHTIEEHQRGAEPLGAAPGVPFTVSVADFLRYWRDKGQDIAGTTPAEPTSSNKRQPKPNPKDSSEATSPAATARLAVRGSVEQIHIIHAKPNSQVTVRGPNGFQATASTDSRGGLVLRNVAPGQGYTVTIDGDEAGSHRVRVMNREQHPAKSFYRTQTLPPAQGYIKTRDGTLLSYRVVLPDRELHGAGPYDLVITYSGYQPSLETADGFQNKPFEKISELGYAVAGVNMRGSGCSGGAFDFMEPLTWLDGYDVVEAFAAQPWVDDIALGDQSWPGLTQLFVASTQPPSLDAIVAGSVVGDFYRDVFFPGGIQNIGFGHIWASGRDVENAWPSRRKELSERVKADPICAANQALRGQNVSLLETIQSHRLDGAFWQGRSAEPLVAKITTPTLQVVSWQDPQVGGRPAALVERFPAGTPVRLIGINGFHQYYSGAVWDEIVKFLDVYLGDTSQEAIADYEAQNAFVVLLESDDQGNARGRFTLPDYSAAGDGERFVLGIDLLPDTGDGTGATSRLRYDPEPPGTWMAPVQDQATFTSKLLTEQTVMAGSGSVDLWIAADADDVDLQVTLSEVRPDGQEMLVQSGWLRASHRALDEEISTPLRPRHLHTADAIKKLIPGEWTSLRIELFPFAHVFRKGSRIRLTVSGPGGAVNAWPWAFDSLPGDFAVRIAHDGKVHTSSLVLPVVQPSDLRLPESLPKWDSVWLQPCRPGN